MEKENRKDKKIHIVGAGVSGLIAAHVLEARGYKPVVLEASDRPGGRVKTDEVQGAYCDRGFQVLLTAYPQAQKWLDYSGLHLHRFKPGALIFKAGKMFRIGDPLRDLSSLWPTLAAPVGSIKDKWKIFKLSRTLKKKSVEAIFETPEQSTLEYLKNYGFSDRMISYFFKPFFTGIFLEEDLRTSSRMFEFTFKMFSEGYAALPAAGIGTISEQLAKTLSRCGWRYQCKVSKVGPDEIELSSGEKLPSDATLVTVPIDRISGEIRMRAIGWKSCDNLYFEVSERSFPEDLIGLVAEEEALVNNLYYPFGQTVDGKPVLSVTVVRDHDLEGSDLVVAVRRELSTHCDIVAGNCVRHYRIKQALPDVEELSMSLQTSQPLKGVFMAGDYLLNGSLNAAMASGEQAAESLIESLEG